jgi:hypothetical protein
MLDRKKILLHLFMWLLLSSILLNIPKLNTILFGTGISSLLIVGSFPWFIIRLLLYYSEYIKTDRNRIKSIFIQSLLTYLICSFPFAVIISFGKIMSHLYDPISNYWSIVIDVWINLFFPVSLFIEWIL